jgi:uncharacterized protein YecT (DUF1311 family)
MKRLIVPAALTFGLGILSAVASGAELSEKFDACLDRAGGVSTAMKACISAEYERQDARLNRSYITLMGSLSADRRAALRDGERKWLKFRDANCRYYDDPGGGSAASIEASYCRLKATADRARELEQFADRQ